MAKILLVDDNADYLAAQTEFLGRAGHQVSTAADGNEALREAGKAAYDLLITDIIMPEREGLETIAVIRKMVPAMKIIAVSGGGRLGARDYLSAARMLGASRTLAKPFSGEELLDVIDAVLRPPA